MSEQISCNNPWCIADALCTRCEPNPTTPDQAGQATSTCNKCGAQHPSAPSGAVHKCGRCSGGMMRPNNLPEESCFSPQGVSGGQDSFAESAKVSPEQIAENANCSQGRIAEARAEWDAIEPDPDGFWSGQRAEWANKYAEPLLAALSRYDGLVEALHEASEANSWHKSHEIIDAALQKVGK